MEHSAISVTDQAPDTALPNRLAATSWGKSALVVVLLSATLCVPMLWLHRDSTRNLISFHGTLHAALGQRFADGAVPPENPYFAGEAVRYYWFYHGLGYLLARALNVSVVYAFEILSVISIILIAAAAVTLGRRLFASTASGAIIFLLVLAGSNPLGWAIFLAKICRDGVRIMRSPATEVVSPMLLQVQFEDHRFGPNLTFFMHMTSRALSIALLVVALWLLWEWMHKGRRAYALMLSVAVALMAAMSPVMGLAAAGALGLALLAMWVWQRRGARLMGQFDALPRAMSGACLLGVGALLALPTMLNILGKSSNVPTVHIDPTRLQLYGIIAVNGFPILLLGLLGAGAGDHASRGFSRVLVVAAAILMAWTALLAMPGTIPPRGVIGNEHNLFNAAMVLLAVPAAGWTGLRTRDIWPAMLQTGKRRMICMLLLFLPTSLLILTAYMGRADLPVRCAPDRLVWTNSDDAVAKLYDWVVTQTPQDAIFIVDPEADIDRLCNVSDFPAFTNRTLYTDFSTYMNESYPQLAFRLQWSKAIARGDIVPLDIRHALAQLRRPVYVLTHQANDAEFLETLQKRYGPPAISAGNIAVFRFHQHRTDEQAGRNFPPGTV